MCSRTKFSCRVHQIPAFLSRAQVQQHSRTKFITYTYRTVVMYQHASSAHSGAPRAFVDTIRAFLHVQGARLGRTESRLGTCQDLFWTCRDPD